MYDRRINEPFICWMLTYMATLAELIACGELFEIEPDLDPGVQPFRYLYAVPGFRRFLEGVQNLESAWNIEQTPAEQLDDLLAEFLGTEPLTVSWRFGPIYPAPGKPWPGVWELKTPDLRIFGWFPVQNKFIAVNGCDAQKVKEYRLYGGFRDEVVRCRGHLPLDEPKYVAGEDFSDVVSLLYRP
jgi:hypothetical protein